MSYLDQFRRPRGRFLARFESKPTPTRAQRIAADLLTIGAGVALVFGGQAMPAGPFVALDGARRTLNTLRK